MATNLASDPQLLNVASGAAESTAAPQASTTPQAIPQSATQSIAARPRRVLSWQSIVFHRSAWADGSIMRSILGDTDTAPGSE